MGRMEKASLDTLERLANALDNCTNLLDQPIAQEQRARIFAVVESPSAENWAEARTILVRGMLTLWAAVGELGLPPLQVPTAEQILEAIER